MQWYMNVTALRGTEAEGCKIKVHLRWQDSATGRKKEEKET